MRNIILVFIILSLCSCSDIETDESNFKTEGDQQSISGKKDINFPVAAKYKNPESMMVDNLIVTVDNTDFLISPDGKVLWGKNFSSSVQLKTELIIEMAYVFKRESMLFVFYTETDIDDATSRLEKIDLANKTTLWQTEIPGFNLGQPYIKEGFAYVTAIGMVGKINLEDGKYIYQIKDLYDDEFASFNSFDKIAFKDSLTIFLSENYRSKTYDSVIVNEKTGRWETRN
jgi:hypothetical protein